MHSQQFGRRTARRLLSLALAGLFLAFAAAAAGAETVYDENTESEAKALWSELSAAYANEASDEVLFAAHFLYDGLGALWEDSGAVLEAFHGIDDFASFEAFVNNGFFDAAQYPGPSMDDVLAAAQAILTAGNLDVPPCHYVQHWDKGFYESEEGWYCVLGDVTAAEEDEASQGRTVRTWYEMYFSGSAGALQLREFSIRQPESARFLAP